MLHVFVAADCFWNIYFKQNESFKQFVSRSGPTVGPDLATNSLQTYDLPVAGKEFIN